jgi:cathepsin E
MSLSQRNLNALIGGNANSVYLIVNNIDTPTGLGLDFVNGVTFLERFYSVYVSPLLYAQLER